MKTEPNASAYPVAPDGYVPEFGLTKREHFAGQILAALCARDDANLQDRGATDAADLAVLLADELVCALNEEPEE